MNHKLQVQLFSLILILISVTSSGQTQKTDHPSLQTLSFITGTISDYNGRFWYVNKPNQIDNYEKYEHPVMVYVSQLVYSETKETVETGSVANSDKYTKGPAKYETYTASYETFSKALAPQINSFYGKDKFLIEDKFRTQAEICSFLTGRYYRYGKKINDSIYAINLMSSPNYYMVGRLLKKAGCKFYLKKKEGEMPAQFDYYFVITKELKEYFGMIDKQKAAFDDSKLAHMSNAFGLTKEEYSNMSLESFKKNDQQDVMKNLD